jgi:hypothetical protein
MTKHGLAHTRFYKIYKGIKTRCYKETHMNYCNYGGRGIKVCDKWKEDFINFRDDMYESYLVHCEEFGEKNTSIDRIDSDGNYEPNNCKWATCKEQQWNTRANVIVEIEGVNYNLSEVSEKFNINITLLRRRYNSGFRGKDLLKEKRSIVSDKQSGVKGIIWNKKSQKWHVKSIKDGKKNTYIGSFDDLDEAINFKKTYDNLLTNF